MASSDVARWRVDWNTFQTMSAELRENSYASKTSGNDRVRCERRNRNGLPRAVALEQQRADAGPSTAPVHCLRRSDSAEGFPRMGIRRIAAHAERAQRRRGRFPGVSQRLHRAGLLRNIQADA